MFLFFICTPLSIGYQIFSDASSNFVNFLEKLRTFLSISVGPWMRIYIIRRGVGVGISGMGSKNAYAFCTGETPRVYGGTPRILAVVLYI